VTVQTADLVPRRNADLQREGERRIEWAAAHMVVLKAIRARFAQEKPFRDLRIGMALHVEAKTCHLALTLAAGGADVRLASCNPDSTDDRVVLAMNARAKATRGAGRAGRGVPVRARKGQTREEYYAALDWVLDAKPHLIIDDGGDLGFLAHTKRTDVLDGIRGGAEETTTGVHRFRAMADDGKLRFPVVNVNDARMKHLFDNRYGTGQSTFDGIFHATNLVIAGKTFVVAGYGWCGRGIATRAKGLGADVIVTEVDPVRAIEARMDGHRVMRMRDAAPHADFVVTATGCEHVVDDKVIARLKDRVVLANAGHFDNEIDKAALRRAARGAPTTVREGVAAYRTKDGRTLHLLADGRLVNLASGQGHPVEIMDTSFGVQALALEYLATNPGLAPGVHAFPAALDDELARLRLASLGITIDALTPAQKAYLAAWEHGT
jgi:adenosylhomocysteinase